MTMTNTQPTLADLAMQAAQRFARLRKLTPEQTADAVSYAWEFAQSGRGTPNTIAWYAVKRVISGRRFRESVRSIDGPPRRDGSQARREEFDLSQYAGATGNPAAAAGFRIDFSEWRANLPDRLREVADILATGESTADAAQRFGVSAGRISQMRRELETTYRETVEQA
jgi:hypothetical protein